MLTCEIFTKYFNTSDVVPSFADHDMFIRYTGLGVGHHAQYRPPTLVNPEVRDPSDKCDDGECDGDKHNNEHDSRPGDGGMEDPRMAAMDEEPTEDDESDDSDSESEQLEDSESDGDETDKDSPPESDDADSDNDSAFQF